jgi:hypothetical protein
LVVKNGSKTRSRRERVDCVRNEVHERLIQQTREAFDQIGLAEAGFDTGAAQPMSQYRKQ